MKDRVPALGKANRVKITQDNGQIVEGVLSYADDATVQGSVYSKGDVLPDDVCDALGIDREGSEPKDALLSLGNRFGGAKIEKTFSLYYGTSMRGDAGTRYATMLFKNYIAQLGGSTTRPIILFDLNSGTELASESYEYALLTCNNNDLFALAGTALLRVLVSGGSVSVEHIASMTYSGTRSFMYANNKYVFVATASGSTSSPLRVFDIVTKTYLGETASEFNANYAGFMIGDYLYTANSSGPATVYRVLTNGISSLGAVTSVSFPAGAILVNRLPDPANTSKIYAIDMTSDKLYVVDATSMSVALALDMSPFVKRNVLFAKDAKCSISERYVYYSAYGIQYVFDLISGDLLVGESITTIDLPAGSSITYSNHARADVRIVDATVDPILHRDEYIVRGV